MESEPVSEQVKEPAAYSSSSNEAVCFSAGLTGVAFGAGVIHAYLAADRKPPKVIAGISLGAVTATAMERCYQSRDGSRAESDRWSWFRRYLTYLLYRPYDILWDAIPNPSDFLADLPPVADPNLPVDPRKKGAEEGEAYDPAEDFDIQARRRLHLLSRAGRWIAHIPVNLSSVAWLIVRYVRMKERYPKPRLLQTGNEIALAANFSWVSWRLILHAILSPQMFPAWCFRSKEAPDSKWYRPLLGWKAWWWLTIFAAAVLEWLVFFPILAVHELRARGGAGIWSSPWVLLVAPLLFLAACAPLLLPLALTVLFSYKANGEGNHKSGPIARYFRACGIDAMEKLGIRKSLFHNFRLRLKLFRLLEKDGKIPTLDECGVSDGSGGKACKLILVSSPLQVLPDLHLTRLHAPAKKTPVQVWPTGKVSLLQALQAALALPGLFEPLTVKEDGETVQSGRREKADTRIGWLKNPGKDIPRLDLVDGAVVRQNPLPALLSFLKLEDNRDAAIQLSEPRSRIYLVYDVPILPRSLPSALPAAPPDKERELPDIIETGFSGQRLARRRDSRLEVTRTNHISQVERILSDALGRPLSGALTVTVEDIAPDEELKLKNELKPTETEILKHIAAGCRQTMGVLFRVPLRNKPAPVDCGEFLREQVSLRVWKEVPEGIPACAEVCRHCSRKLSPAIIPTNDLLPPAFSSAGPEIAKSFPRLDGRTPRIVLLASGGVFRGTFHVGMLGALLAANIKPDMIVGASVGSLMGAVAGAMFASDSYEEAHRRLTRLSLLFVEVDHRVALTRSFKAAMKDLGIRGRSRSLQISPNALRRMVAAGSRRDAGLAATGAPPALIDAISDLFLIPYQRTRGIAARFIAGHIEEALQAFWQQIRTETIQQLGVRDGIIGASLIERELREVGILLKDGRASPQPFLEKGIAFFATTVNLVTEWVNVLGAELNPGSYDFVEALLASSAFPTAFAPRRASAVYPGLGRRDVFFGDGGMFDNLPFLPAYQVLGKLQKARLAGAVGTGAWCEDLLRRRRYPDLCLVGALEAQVGQDDEAPDKAWDTLFEILGRAGKLADNEKIYGFQRAASLVDMQLGKLAEAVASGAEVGGGTNGISAPDEQYLNGVVNSAVLPVFPSNKDYLNGTFHFCAALGMKRERVRRSIGDGCFRTLYAIAEAQAGEHDGGAPPLCERTVANFTEALRIPRIRIKPAERSDGVCPFFVTSAVSRGNPGTPALGLQARLGRLPCPFHGIGSEHSSIATIYSQCCKDEGHRHQAGSPAHARKRHKPASAR